MGQLLTEKKGSALTTGGVDAFNRTKSGAQRIVLTDIKTQQCGFLDLEGQGVHDLLVTSQELDTTLANPAFAERLFHDCGTLVHIHDVDELVVLTLDEEKQLEHHFIRLAKQYGVDDKLKIVVKKVSARHQPLNISEIFLRCPDYRGSQDSSFIRLVTKAGFNVDQTAFISLVGGAEGMRNASRADMIMRGIAQIAFPNWEGLRGLLPHQHQPTIHDQSSMKITLSVHRGCGGLLGRLEDNCFNPQDPAGHERQEVEDSLRLAAKMVRDTFPGLASVRCAFIEMDSERATDITFLDL